MTFQKLNRDQVSRVLSFFHFLSVFSLKNMLRMVRIDRVSWQFIRKCSTLSWNVEFISRVWKIFDQYTGFHVVCVSE